MQLKIFDITTYTMQNRLAAAALLFGITEQGQVVYMALEDTFISLQSRMYELTDEKNPRR